FFISLRPPLRFPLFPYTTLFRSVRRCGELNFSVVQRFVDDIVALPDKEIFEAMIWVMERCKLVLEGAAAAPVAALLHGLVRLPRSEEHTSELQSRSDLVCRLLLE